MEEVKIEEAEEVKVMVNDPDEMEIAKKASWMSKLFIDNKLTVEDKQEIYRRLAKELKKQELIESKTP